MCPDVLNAHYFYIKQGKREKDIKCGGQRRYRNLLSMIWNIVFCALKIWAKICRIALCCMISLHL